MFIPFPEVHVPMQGLDEVKLPLMVPICQQFDAARIEDPAGYLTQALERSIPAPEQFAGKRIAVTVGSRGIPALAEMVKAICDALKRWGAEPFIVPAMGSHGGANAAGQVELLTGYGVTESAVGAPIRSSMEVVSYGQICGEPLYGDKLAFESDGTVVFNKVKPHTEFRAAHESGLLKMVAIGLGNHRGATQFHSFGFDRFPELLPKVGEQFLATGKLAFGVGVVQNAYDYISDIQVCTSENFMETDAALQAIAKEKMGKFLFDHIDLLIIDEIGKNISGTGCDPNVVGRNLSNTFHDMLDLKKLLIRSITPESHGSGVGLGMADMTTRKCLCSVDWEATWANVLTTGSMTGGRIPLYANNDREAILQCLRTGKTDVTRPCIVRIRNTLCMDRFWVSQPLFARIRNLSGIRQDGDPAPLRFDENGDLL